jgi:hypothetical protein
VLTTVGYVVAYLLKGGHPMTDTVIRSDATGNTTGYLMPPGAERGTEYNIRFRNGSGQFVVDEDLNSYDPPIMGDVESDLLGADAHPVQRQELTWPDGSRWTGPWQKVAP